MTEKKKKQDHEKKISELTDTLKRVQADFENYKKRIEKENSMFIKCAKNDLILKLLPITESLQKALDHKDDKEFINGICLISDHLKKTLEHENLKEIEALGKKFDPHFHEVLISEKSKEPEGTILEVIQPGYMINNMIIKHSKVKIAKNDPEEHTKEKSD